MEPTNNIEENTICSWNLFDLEEQEILTFSQQDNINLLESDNTNNLTTQPPSVEFQKTPFSPPSHFVEPSTIVSSTYNLTEEFRLHQTNCRYVERKKFFELSWSCPIMASYSWLIDKHSLNPIQSYIEGKTNCHRSFVNGSPIVSSSFRMEAEVGIKVDGEWISLQRCCLLCAPPIVLFNTKRTNISTSGDGKIATQVYFTRTHNRRPYDTKACLRLKCVIVDTNSTFLQQYNIISLHHTQYEMWSNWIELPFRYRPKKPHPFNIIHYVKSPKKNSSSFKTFSSETSVRKNSKLLTKNLKENTPDSTSDEPSPNNFIVSDSVLLQQDNSLSCYGDLGLTSLLRDHLDADNAQT